MGNSDDIHENMERSNKILVEMKIIMNKRNEVLRDKYADLAEVQYALANIHTLTRPLFDECILKRTMIMAEIVVLEELYEKTLENMKLELTTLNARFQKLAEQCF